MILKTDLYNHQKQAVEKLRHIKVGALYMEMGTGKTRTALELIKIRLDAGKVNKVLWLCPCSVKDDLRRGIDEHSDGADITICGIETLSSSVAANSKLLEMVTSHEVYLIVDESNLVKNHMACRTQNIIRLAERCKYKLILNGTPISRCEKDLFSQWYILDWRILGYASFWSFAANHLEYDEKIPGRINRCLNTDYLVRKISPYTYQTKKSECLDLPEKSYETLRYNITGEQRYHYEYVAEKLFFETDEMAPATIYRMFSGLMAVTSGFRIDVSGDHITREPFFQKPTDNPRMQKLLEVIENISDKIIIFCRYTQEINDIADTLNSIYGPNQAVRFFGEMNNRCRNESLNNFREESQFLVANKTCAGYGLNLQFCSYVIYYSNDWDYATRAQSEDRVHRIGQKNNVHIIDISASETLDERILRCLWKKENLVDGFKNEIEKTKNKRAFAEEFVYGKKKKRREDKLVNAESILKQNSI